MSMLMRRAMQGSGPTDFTLTISANRVGFDLRALALSNGWNGVVKVNCVINSAVNVTSSTASTPAITVAGSFPGGVSLTNSGNIYGMGGNGGAGGLGNGTNPGSPGVAGGTALSVSVTANVTNNGAIVGGGGGGGGGGGEAGGNTGGAGGKGAYAATAAVAGVTPPHPAGSGGAGGALGGVGTSGATSGIAGASRGAGGAAGKSINGNSNITWLATGTRTGPIT